MLPLTEVQQLTHDVLVECLRAHLKLGYLTNRTFLDEQVRSLTVTLPLMPFAFPMTVTFTTDRYAATRWCSQKGWSRH